MKKNFLFFAAVLLVSASGCATVSTPWYEELKSYPMIRLGEEPPKDGMYVVHLPAGEPVPTKLLIEGNIFERESAGEVSVLPRRDIYFYKNHMSFDMKTWKRARAALDLHWDFEVPSYERPEPGYVKIKVDERE